jgi:hypothetical protein
MENIMMDLLQTEFTWNLSFISFREQIAKHAISVLNFYTPMHQCSCMHTRTHTHIYTYKTQERKAKLQATNWKVTYFSQNLHPSWFPRVHYHWLLIKFTRKFVIIYNTDNLYRETLNGPYSILYFNFLLDTFMYWTWFALIIITFCKALIMFMLFQHLQFSVEYISFCILSLCCYHLAKSEYVLLIIQRKNYLATCGL